MHLEEIIRDATRSQPGASLRSVITTAAEMLNERHQDDPISAKAVAKWVERKSITGKWLMRLAALPKPPLDLTKYV